VYYAHDYYNPSGVTIEKRAYIAANRGSRNTGVVSLSGTPDGWDGATLSCSGAFTFFVGLDLPGSHPYFGNYFGASALTTPGGGVSFELALAEADSSLSWSDSCALTTLPVIPLSHTFGTDTLLYDSAPRYTADSYSYNSDLFIGSGTLLSFNYNNLFDLTSETPFTWQGTY
jgi:hypothetical protein